MYIHSYTKYRAAARVDSIVHSGCVLDGAATSTVLRGHPIDVLRKVNHAHRKTNCTEAETFLNSSVVTLFKSLDAPTILYPLLAFLRYLALHATPLFHLYTLYIIPIYFSSSHYSFSLYFFQHPFFPTSSFAVAAPTSALLLFSIITIYLTAIRSVTSAHGERYDAVMDNRIGETP